MPSFSLATSYLTTNTNLLLPTAGQFVLVVVGVALVCILGVAGLGYCLHPPPGGRGACLGAR